MSQDQRKGYSSQDRRKWRRTKPSKSSYTIDRRPQPPQGKKSGIPQSRKPQVLPRKRQEPLPSRSALKWQRKEEESKAKDDARKELRGGEQPQKPESQEEDNKPLERAVFKRPCYTDRFLPEDEDD
ncbi:uncharacterized protein LOC124363841 [Homalodisca vitripennis]|uniref:uncharacterized protein LOC124363841 n=1 Tax=Homalodisca vitripennis TaxID=197043 RepID=UPI001EE9E966|nr:uncharacterized protein LOC124363841 [Homalodisca vitripennis]